MKVSIPSFGRAGRPRQIKFSDLFLWDPMLEFELNGMSMTEMFGSMGPEMLSIYRDMGRRKSISTKRARSVIPAALKASGFPYAEELEQAFDGQATRFKDFGPWEMIICTSAIKANGPWPPVVSRLGSHLIAVERSLVEPTAAWRNRDMARCVDLIESSPVLADYLWPEALTQLREGDADHIRQVRIMVMLELFLSRLAGWDAQKCIEGLANDSIFERLFPDVSAEKLTQPNTLFFNWLGEHSGVKSGLARCVPQITKREKDGDLDSAKRQLRNWRRGASFPSPDVLDALFSNLFEDQSRDEAHPLHQKRELSWHVAMATRRANFLVPLLHSFRHVQWHVDPYGYKNIQQWRTNRYAHWYEHWLALLATN